MSCVFVVASGIAQQKTVFTEQVYKRINDVYGSNAAEDVADWRQLIDELQQEAIDHINFV